MQDVYISVEGLKVSGITLRVTLKKNALNKVREAHSDLSKRRMKSVEIQSTTLSIASVENVRHGFTTVTS